MKKFTKSGNPLGAKQDAQVVGEELERIYEKHGKLDAAIVVEESKPKDAVLHSEFEWNNAKAGHAWRVHQARNIIRDVKADKVQDYDASTAAYVSVSAPTEEDQTAREYRRIEDVLADPVQRAALVQRALEKLVRVQHEFRHLRELANVWSAIDSAIETGVV